MHSRKQPNLFDDVGALPPPSPDLVALGARVPPNVRLGTSTWTYDGWTGEVYHRTYRSAQPARRLEEYARYPLFRTVGIDSAFYEPPSEEVLTAYARALPPGFPCVSKVWDRITARRFTQDPRWGTNRVGRRAVTGRGGDVSFADVASGKVRGRTARDQITYSERGNIQGVQFFAVAAAAYEAARREGLGRDLPTDWFLQDIRD